MISVCCERTLKWSLYLPPPSFLRALIKWGFSPSISPIASLPPILVCGPLYLLATATQTYLFPGVEKGEKTGRGHQEGSQGLLLPSFMALKTQWGTQGPPLRAPHHPCLCPRSSRPPFKVWRFKTCLHPLPTSPLSPLPIF